MNAKYLLGKDHADPAHFVVESLDEHAAIGLASVVTKEQKSHNWANNEDAAGIYCDDTATILMVADGHWGYAASQEAVLRFPQHFLDVLGEVRSRPAEQQVEPQGSLLVPKAGTLKFGMDVDSMIRNLLSGKKTETVPQAYLEAIIRLSYDICRIGELTNIVYVDGARSRVDASNTQFHSLVEVNGQKYSVGLGDCLRVLIRGDRAQLLESINSHITIGRGLTPNNYMRETQYGEGLSRDSPMCYDDPRVRKGVDVQLIQGRPGDVFFMCSDGFPLEQRKDLPHLFKRRDVSEVICDLMEEVVAQRNIDYHDNVALAAIRFQ